MARPVEIAAESSVPAEAIAQSLCSQCRETAAPFGLPWLHTGAGRDPRQLEPTSCSSAWPVPGGCKGTRRVADCGASRKCSSSSPLPADGSRFHSCGVHREGLSTFAGSRDRWHFIYTSRWLITFPMVIITCRCITELSLAVRAVLNQTHLHGEFVVIGEFVVGFRLHGACNKGIVYNLFVMVYLLCVAVMFWYQDLIKSRQSRGVM